MSFSQQFARKSLVKAAPRQRPYWHVDAKWIFSLLLSVVLAVWLVQVVIYKVTDRDTGTKLLTNVITLGIKKGSLADQQKSLEELRAKVQASATKSIQPIPGFPATITEADLQLTPDQLVQKVFGQVSAPMYDQGIRAVAEQHSSNRAEQEKFIQQASVLGFFSKEQHKSQGKVVWWLLAVVLLLTAGAAWFSSGFGRLVTPAVVLLVVAVPALMVSNGLYFWTTHPGDVLAANPTNPVELLSAARGSFVPVAEAARQVYLVAVLCGVGLLMAAVIGKIVVRFWPRRGTTAGLIGSRR